MSVPAIVAVTGATGFTGGQLSHRLAVDGYAVRALTRRPPPETGDGIDWVRGELDDEAAAAALVRGADTCFHIAAMYRSEGPREAFLAANAHSTALLLGKAREAGVRRFVYCSSIGVHGSVARSPADEDAPFDPRDPYQESKLLAEERCRAEMAVPGMEIVIVRPCAIYGPGDTRMLKMFRMLERNRFFFIGAAAANFHPVFIDDLVEGLMLAMTTPGLAGKTYILGGADYLPLRDYVGAAARAIGRRPPSASLPYGGAQAAAWLCETICAPLGVQPPLHRRRLTFFKHNRAFSIARARRELGYAPRVGLDEGFRRTVAWYRREGLLP